VEPLTKTVTIDGQDYTLGVIKTGLGRKLRSRAGAEPSDFNVAFLAASLNAGGNPEATPEWVDENLPFFGTFNVLWAAAIELNGLKAPSTGDAQPEPGPAPVSTSGITTVQ